MVFSSSNVNEIVQADFIDNKVVCSKLDKEESLEDDIFDAIRIPLLRSRTGK